LISESDVNKFCTFRSYVSCAKLWQNVIRLPLRIVLRYQVLTSLRIHWISSTN